MATDIRFDDGPSGTWLTLEAPALKVEGSDLILDSSARRGDAVRGFRRALVHGDADTLHLNFEGDYTGGVSIRDARINVAVVNQSGAPKLPKVGAAGDLLVTQTRSPRGAIDVGTRVTLWLCIGRPDQMALGGGVYWVPLSTGEAVEGSA